MPYKITNWERYQGRKSRGHNPWVKLHKSLLVSPDFFGLSDKHRWQQVLLLLLANDTTGVIDLPDEQIAFKLRLSSFDPKPFLGHFLEDLNHTTPSMAPSGIPLGNQGLARSSLSNSSLDQKEEIVTPNWQSVQKWFTKFWAAYPRKQKKKDAERAWKKIVDMKEEKVEHIIEAVEAAKLTEQWSKNDGKFIPLPATWINAEQWEDVLEIGGAVGKDYKKGPDGTYIESD